MSAADKLHNARATIGDLRASRRWAEFNACHHQSLWYYSIVSAIIGERLSGSRTSAKLDLTVSELYGLTDDVERPGRVDPYVPSCQCESAATVQGSVMPATEEALG